jgi:hypothetical protein
MQNDTAPLRTFLAERPPVAPKAVVVEKVNDDEDDSEVCFQALSDVSLNALVQYETDEEEEEEEEASGIGAGVKALGFDNEPVCVFVCL